MKRFVCICILFSFSAFGGDFEEDLEEENERKVILRETAFSRDFSILTIHLFLKLDEYFFKPFSLFYGSIVPYGFEEGVKNAMKNISDTGHILDNALVFSHQRLISSIGKALVNNSLGFFGTTKLSAEFGIVEADITFSDVLRFYGMPELYFFSIGGIPFTLTATLALPVEILRGRYYSLTYGFFSDFLVNAVNERALNQARYDLAVKLGAQSIYNLSKIEAYRRAKYFKINRNLYAQKKEALQNFLQERELEKF